MVNPIVEMPPGIDTSDAEEVPLLPGAASAEVQLARTIPSEQQAPAQEQPPAESTEAPAPDLSALQTQLDEAKAALLKETNLRKTAEGRAKRTETEDERFNNLGNTVNDLATKVTEALAVIDAFADASSRDQLDTFSDTRDRIRVDTQRDSQVHSFNAQAEENLQRINSAIEGTGLDLQTSPELSEVRQRWNEMAGLMSSDSPDIGRAHGLISRALDLTHTAARQAHLAQQNGTVQNAQATAATATEQVQAAEQAAADQIAAAGVHDLTTPTPAGSTGTPSFKTLNGVSYQDMMKMSPTQLQEHKRQLNEARRREGLP